MKRKIKTTWLIGGLALVIIVALILGSNPQLFRGRIDSFKELYGLTTERCQQLKRWYDEGSLSSKLDRDSYDEPTLCSIFWPHTWNPVENPTDDTRCRDLKRYLDAGVLTSKIGSDMTEANACARTFPVMWSYQFFPSQERCLELRRMDDEGLFSGPAAPVDRLTLTEIQRCNTRYPSTWNNGRTSVSRCMQLKEWLDAGVLSSKLSYETSWQPSLCAGWYRDIWYPTDSTLSMKQCAAYQTWFAAGVLSAKLGSSGDYMAAVGRCSSTYPSIWDSGRPSASRCSELRRWFDANVLTTKLGGVTYEAQRCADTRPDIWFH